VPEQQKKYYDMLEDKEKIVLLFQIHLSVVVFILKKNNVPVPHHF